MNRERVQELRDVIAGIPEEQIDLDEVYAGDWNGLRGLARPPEPCGTIACIAGWALIYPPFVNAGIKKEHGYAPTEKCANFFKVPNTGLFGMRKTYERGTHKQIALKRLDDLLDIAGPGAVSTSCSRPARSPDLAKLE